LQKVAFVRFSGDNGRTGLAPLLQETNEPQIKSAFEFVRRSVTVETVSPKNRPNIPFVRENSRGIGRDRSRSQWSDSKNCQHCETHQGNPLIIETDSVASLPIGRQFELMIDWRAGNVFPLLVPHKLRGTYTLSDVF
jgi:hypothetical protein